MEFDSDAETASRLLSDVSFLINERDQLRRSGGNVADVSGRLRGALIKAERQIDRVASAVKDAETSKPSVSAKELQRRRDMLRRQQTELARLKTLEKSAVAVAAQSSDRDALLGADHSGGRKYAAGTDGATAPRATPEQLLMRTQTEMKAQDDILDSMSKGLDGLKTMGVAIRDEADLHMKLLDDLEEQVDKGQGALKRETARAEHITRDTKTCWLYVTICILLAALVGLVAGRWA